MKKSVIYGVLASTLALSPLSQPIFATDFVAEQVQSVSLAVLSTSAESDFKVVNGVLTQYLGSGGDVVIPSVINGEIVTSIGETAFQGNETVLSVVIPSTVTKISGGDLYVTQGAFMGCSNLKTISIPDSVTTIESFVFKLCSSLEYIVIPDSVTFMGANVFERCYNMTSVKIGNGVVAINENVFAECSSLRTLQLGHGITRIGNTAFELCTSLEEIVLPSALLSVGEYPFNYCTSLKRIIFPASFTNVTKDIIGHCDNLEYAIFLNRQASFEPLTLESYKQPSDMSRFYMVGYEDSTTQTFATEKGFNFMSISDYEKSFGVITSGAVSNNGNAFDISQYNDVESGKWYYPYVVFALDAQLISGSDGMFFPEEASDRGTVAQALANFSGQAQGYSLPSTYTDVSNYQEGVAWCIEKAVMSGYSAKTFGTGNSLTRQEFAVSLMALAKEMDEYTPTDINRLNQFIDADEIATWAEVALSWAVENSYINGKGSGRLDPEGDVTRGEVAAILSSFSDNIQAKIDKLEEEQREELAQQEALSKLKSDFAKSTYDKFYPIESTVTTGIASVESQVNTIMTTKFASQTMITVDPSYKDYTSYPKFNSMMDEARLTAGPLFLALQQHLAEVNESYTTCTNAGISFDSYENYLRVLTQLTEEGQVMADFLWDTYEDYYYDAQKQDPAPVMPEMKTTLNSYLDTYDKYKGAYDAIMQEFKDSY